MLYCSEERKYVFLALWSRPHEHVKMQARRNEGIMVY